MEGTHGASVAIEVVGGGIFDVEGVDIDFDAERVADVFYGFSENGERFEPEEVHFDESGFLDDLTFILRAVEFFAGFFVVGGADGDPVADVVAADDEATGMHAGVAHISFEHFGVANGVAHEWVVRGFGFPQFGDRLDGIGQVHLGHLAVGPCRQLVGNEFAQAVGFRKRELEHAGHVFDGQFCGHRSVSDDVGHFFCTIFIGHPLQHASASVVVEVHIDIRERNTVGIQEALEEEVIFNRVDVGDAQAVSHGTARGRSTPRADRDTELLASCLDVVLHDEEVAREAHRLHDVQFKLDARVGFFVERIAVTPLRSFVSQLAEIVRLEFDAIEFVVSAEFLDLGLAFFAVDDHIAVFVLREFIVELLFGKPFSVLLFRSEFRGNVEVGHDGAMVDAVDLHLVDDLLGGGKRFRQIGEDFVHFRLCFEPFLLRVEHARRIVDEVVGGKADEEIVCLGIFFVGKVRVVGANVFHAAFLGELQQCFVGLHLQRVGFAVGTLRRIFDFVPLEFEIIVLSENLLEPSHRFFGALEVATQNLARNFSAQAGRRNDESLFESLEIGLVRAGLHVEAVDPRATHELDEIVVAGFVLGQDDEVPAAAVGLVLLVRFGPARAVHLTAVDGFEVQNALCLFDLLLAFGDEFLVGLAGVGIDPIFVGRVFVGPLA